MLAVLLVSAAAAAVQGSREFLFLFSLVALSLLYFLS